MAAPSKCFTIPLVFLLAQVAGFGCAHNPTPVAVDKPIVDLNPANLRIENLTNPLGLDEKSPRLSWLVESAQRGQKQTAYRILVGRTEEALQADRGDEWDSGKVDGGRISQIVYGGKPLRSHQYYWWKVQVWDKDDKPSAWSAAAMWSMGFLDPAEWKGQWIGYDKARQAVKSAGLILPPPALLRTDFVSDKPIRHATLYATALGLYDITLNGKRVGDDYFGPGWTDYTKRVYYRAYDVTPLIKRGGNAWCAVLADGWYCGYLGYNHIRDHYGKKSRLRAQIHVEYDDGTTGDFYTGPDWKASTGPYLEADFLMGEVYDPSRIPEGWDVSGFNMAKWGKVDLGAEVKPIVQHHPGPAVKALYEIKPVAITEPKPGAYVLDMGQNFAGVARLKVAGEAGQKIVLRFAERLNPDGTIYTANLRSARAADTYICKGGGVETWQPRFTYHGFQYVEVTGLKTKPADDTVTGIALTSETPPAGSFACSDSMLNQLYRNITWTQRANFIAIPTDCPQRDERLGWTGDAQVYVRTATLNADVEAFFTKWLVDLEDGQRQDGEFPMVAPVKVAENDGGPAWADAGVICPWTIYEVYGDKRLLERHYDSMVRFVEFCRKRSTPDLLPPKQYHCFGDWLSIRAETPKDVIYMAYFAKSTRLVAQAAEVLGKTEDAKKYNYLLAKIKAAFNRRYVNSKGEVEGKTQAGYVLAIAFDLLDDSMLKLAARHLVDDIEQRKDHLSTGFIGTKDLMLALSKIERTDVAFRLLHQETFPSWGFSIKQGATSIWERWDGWTPDHGFQDPGMNSFAHYSFGAVYQWIVENIGGIRMAAPGYDEIAINPQLDPHLHWAKTSYRSARGRIESSWKREEAKFTLDVTLPPGTTGSICLPASNAVDITEGGKPVAEAPGVILTRIEGDRAYLTVGSGTFHFRSSVAPPAR